jgi:hypothetical protein
MGEVTYLIEIEASTGSDTIFSLPDVEITRALALEPHEQSMVLFVADVLTDELRTVTWLPNPPPGTQARLFRREGRQVKFRFWPLSPTTDSVRKDVNLRMRGP